jgi:hypothetical protein
MVQDEEKTQDRGEVAQRPMELVPTLPPLIDSPFPYSSILVLPRSSVASFTCVQPNSCFNAAVNSSSSGRVEERVMEKQESRMTGETAVKDADETTEHSSTQPISPSPVPSDAEPLSHPFCMTVYPMTLPSSTPEIKSSPQFIRPVSVDERRKRLAGSKRKIKHTGGGGKQKSSRRMMP